MENQIETNTINKSVANSKQKLDLSSESNDEEVSNDVFDAEELS